MSTVQIPHIDDDNRARSNDNPLFTLPVELRAKIYGLVFAGAPLVRFIDRARIPCRYHHQQQHQRSQTPYAPLLSLQLTSRSFLADPCLQVEFLRNIVLSLHGPSDLADLSRHRHRVPLKHVRHVAVRNPDPNPLHLLLHWHRRSARVCRYRHCNQTWTELEVETVARVFPGLQTVTTVPHGPSVVDITRRDFCPHEYHHMASLTDFPPAPSSSPCGDEVRMDFAHALAGFLRRTAQLFRPHWYWTFLHAALDRSWRVTYTLRLVLESDPLSFDENVVEVGVSLREGGAVWLDLEGRGPRPYGFVPKTLRVDEGQTGCGGCGGGGEEMGRWKRARLAL